VLRGNADEMNKLFKKVLEPKQWKAVDSSRTKAFSAFDELTTVSPADKDPCESVSPLSAQFPAPEVVGPTSSASSSQQGTAPTRDSMAALAEVLKGLAPQQRAGQSGAHQPLTAHHLQGLSPQELLQMQGMISSALKANQADPFAGAMETGVVDAASQPFGDLLATLNARKPSSSLDLL